MMMAFPLEPFLSTLYYAYPALIFTYYFLSYALAILSLRTDDAPRHQHPRRRLVNFLVIIAILTYLAQFALVLASSSPVLPQDATVCLLACALVFGLELTILHDTKYPLWYLYVGSLVFPLLFDPLIEALSLLSRHARSSTSFFLLDISLVATRLTCVVITLVIHLAWKNKRPRNPTNDPERQSLLRKKISGNSDETLVSEYGTADGESNDSGKSSNDGPEHAYQRRQRLAMEQRNKRLKETGSWWTYALSFKLFLPYIWPVGNRGLQLRIVLVGACLLANNGLSVLIPTQLGILMDTLTRSYQHNQSSSSVWESPWTQVLIFAALKLSASEAGFNLLRCRLWMPVQYYADRAIMEAAHAHVMNLDANFHDTQSLSDVLMAIQNGQSVSTMLETICFQAFPNAIDLVAAFIYLTAKFGPYEGLITMTTCITFLYMATAVISRLRSSRENEISALYDEHYILQSGISGWSTVCSFNQIRYEEDRFSSAIQDRITKQSTVCLAYYAAHAIQYLVLLAGLLAGLFLAVYQVSKRSTTPGDFVALLTFWGQLMSPLNFFASLGRNVSRDLLQAERLLVIMQTKSSVVNKPDAPPFQFKAGLVEFKGVKFSYDQKKQVLKNINFSVKPGQTIAFVGQTGAGKSTILKLLDRFYDVTEGCIKIDGQDVREVDLHSLRANIGVVPQNPCLFNDTIINNIRYARLEASDEEVYEACRAAAVHDQILGFSEGYNTRVGERGLRLSGGELQRVAIARAILKRPKIVLLDEATSAVDTETEFRIQKALRRLCKHRTTFIVAHRLSTVVNADVIAVVIDGEIQEQGNHESLIAFGGKYADLWSKQIFFQQIEIDKDNGSEGAVDQDETNTPEVFMQLNAKKDASKVKESAKHDVNHSIEVKTSSGHRKEGTSLNPGAPEFTPRSAVKTAVPQDSAAIVPITIACDPFSTASVTKVGTPCAKTSDRNCPAVLASPVPAVATSASPIKIQTPYGPVVSFPRPMNRSWTQSTLEGSNSNEDDKLPTEAPAGSAAAPGVEQNKNSPNVSYKMPRMSGNRRNQSRSEPFDSSNAKA